MATITLDLPDDVLQKLEQIARHQSTWDASKPRVDVEYVIHVALNAYLKERISSTGGVLPDVRADGSLEPASPIVRATNALLVHAIDRGILEFQIPEAPGSTTDAQIAALFPEHIRPWLLRRLQVMTTPRTGIIPITHKEESYDILVEFEDGLDSNARVRVKIIPRQSLPRSLGG